MEKTTSISFILMIITLFCWVGSLIIINKHEKKTREHYKKLNDALVECKKQNLAYKEMIKDLKNGD